MSTQSLNTGSSVDASTTPSPEGHDAAMAAKFDAAQKPPAQPEGAPQEQRPEWLPEKFKTPEELRKAYDELVSKFSKGEHKKADEAAPKADEAKPENTPEVDPNAPKQDEAKEAVEKAGLDFDAMSARFAEKGELPAEDYEALEKAGISKDLVDAYIEGQKALAAVERQQALAEFGGEEAYGKMVSWAATALSPEDIAAYNATVASGDMAQVKLAVAGLKARFEAANGSEPKLVNSEPATNNAGFESRAQLTAAMRDPRYAKDPAYRESVQRRLAASNIF